MSERLPAPQAHRIAATAPRPDELHELPAGTPLLRIHPLSGPHPCAWNQFRRFGPTSARFDHHPPPPREHELHSIIYCTTGSEAFVTALAEYFQDGAGRVGPIDRRAGTPAVTMFRLTAPLQVLDLRSGWVARAGGNQSLVSGIRSSSRAWTRAIHQAHPVLQGLLSPSSMWGPGLCVTVWERGEPAVAAANDLHRTLGDPAMRRPLADAAERLGTILLP